MKTRFNRLLAVILSLLCLFVALPGLPSLSIEADAATATGGVQTRINEVMQIFPSNSYFTTNGKASSGSGAKECCYPEVVKNNPKVKALNLNWKNMWKSYSCCGFAHFTYRYIFGKEFNAEGAAAKTTVSTINNSNLDNLFSSCQPGDVIQWTYNNKKYSGQHYMIFLKYTAGKQLVVYDCNVNGECKVTVNHPFSYSWIKSNCSKIYRYHANNYDTINGIFPSVTKVAASNITNTAAQITSQLNQSFTVQKWTYFLSTDKKAVSNVNGTNSSMHKSTDTMDCVRVLDYTSNPQKQSAASFSIEKYKGKSLTANTTYYYKVAVMIGGTWYQTGVNSFTTANVKPNAPTLRIASGNEVVGIGDQVTVLWDAVNGAESYTITVQDDAQNIIQEQSGITGTTCVLDGVDTAGTYQVTISAVNSAGAQAGNTAILTVNPNVNVTFYDTIGETEIAVVSVPYGHAASAPKNPVHEGHTFSKWDASFEQVTSDMIVHTVYDKNFYTVKFFDSFTNALLKTQTVKYEESATAPSVAAPEGYTLTAWDQSFDCVKSDLNVYTVYAWTDEDHSATVSIDSVVRNTTEQGYDVTMTITNRISQISSGRVVVALKSENGVILTTTESNAFALEGSESKTLSMTVLYPDLASNIEVYVVNGYNSLGKLSKTASDVIDNSTSTEWSDWIDYADVCPMTESDTLKVETRVLEDTTPTKTYYRYQIRENTTSYNTSMSGYTQDGYELVESSAGTVSYVASWPSGFDTSNAWYKKYNVTPKSASETATQKIVIHSTANEGYLYWHWCRNQSLGAAYNRCISYSKTSTYSKFHCFYDTKSVTEMSPDKDAYKYVTASNCGDSYWWGKLAVKKQTYTVYNKLYNYYKLSDYSDWIEYEGTVPVSEGGSAGTNKTYVNVETMTVEGTTTSTNQYRYMATSNPTIEEPVVDSARVVNLSGNVGSEFAGKDVTVWVYKYAQASDYTTEYVKTTIVAEDGSVDVSDAVLLEAPTVLSGDYTIAASVDGQERAIRLGTIEAPKPEYTVTFYDFDQSVISTQIVTEGENAELPDVSQLHVPEGSRFTNWSESVVHVKSNMNVYPESETETYTVAIVNWEVQTVELKKFNYGAELIVDSVPEGKEGYLTQWVVRDGEDYVTIDEFTESGKTVTSDMVVVTRSMPEQYTVTILDADQNEIIGDKIQESNNMDELEVASTEIITNGEHIDFSVVQTTIEEAEDLIFMGWINAETGEAVNDTRVTESMILYPSYVFAETTEAPVADIETGEYTSAQTVTLTSETADAVIWYTTDGTDPKTSQTAVEYTQPLTISTSCTLRYYASALGCNDSDENSAIYAINLNGNPVYHVVSIEIVNVTDVDLVYGASYWLVKDGTMLPENICENINGHDFDGLYFDESLTEPFYFDAEAIDTTMTLYANYIPKNYTVTFTDYDGTVLSTESVSYMGAAAAPEEPVREGYAFVGWDNELDCITEDTTIQAQYIAEDEYASVSLNRSKTITLNEGTIFQYLKATITPDIHSDYALVWSSSDPSVATVDENGIITAVAIGTAAITVTIPYTGASASCSVKVSANPDQTILLKSTASIGLDSERNLRGVKAGNNTVADLLAQFENENLVCYDSEGTELTETDLVGTGATIRLYEGETLLDSVKVAVVGDFNGDGLFNNKDIVMVNQYVVEKRTADAIQMIAADVNGDGFVNNRDCSILSRYSVGKEEL
ncbi:MAG: InlB B-repeat-containing protein [Ruminococcus sp.]